MSSPILSQNEIDALLHNNNSESLHEELVVVLKSVIPKMTNWVVRSTGEVTQIDGPYVERLGRSLGQSITENVYIGVADLGASEILMFMSQADSNALAEQFRASPGQAVQMLSQAWLGEMANLLGVQHRLFQVQKLSPGSLAQLPVEEETFLIRHLIHPGEDGLEFCLLIKGSDAPALLEYQTANKVNPVLGSASHHREVSPRGRLLKGNKSPVTRATFSPLDLPEQETRVHAITLLEDIDLLVTVELGRVTLTLNELLELKPQSVIRLERHAGEHVDVYVNNNRAAKGEVMVLEDNFGVRILEIVPKSERIREE